MRPCNIQRTEMSALSLTAAYGCGDHHNQPNEEEEADDELNVRSVARELIPFITFEPARVTQLSCIP